MDERALKRLLFIVAVSIIAILLFKTMMSRTIVNLNKAAEEKRLAAARTTAQSRLASPATDTANPVDVPAASAAGVVASPETSTSSGVGEPR